MFGRMVRRAALAGAAALMISGSAHADLIVNGGFEDAPVAHGSFGIFNSITGWTSTFGSGIEVQDHAAGSPYEGHHLVELDSNNNSGMKQSVGTSAGELYNLSFAFSARPNVASDSNGIDVWWGGSLLAQITADGTGLSDTSWSIENFVVSATGALTDLEFRATGISDSLGGYLDAVSLTRVAEPATIAVFGLGLAGLGFMRRRRAA